MDFNLYLLILVTIFSLTRVNGQAQQPLNNYYVYTPIQRQSNQPIKLDSQTLEMEQLKQKMLQELTEYFRKNPSYDSSNVQIPIYQQQIGRTHTRSVDNGPCTDCGSNIISSTTSIKNSSKVVDSHRINNRANNTNHDERKDQDSFSIELTEQILKLALDEIVKLMQNVTKDGVNKIQNLSIDTPELKNLVQKYIPIAQKMIEAGLDSSKNSRTEDTENLNFDAFIKSTFKNLNNGEQRPNPAQTSFSSPENNSNNNGNPMTDVPNISMKNMFDFWTSFQKFANENKELENSAPNPSSINSNSQFGYFNNFSNMNNNGNNLNPNSNVPFMANNRQSTNFNYNNNGQMRNSNSNLPTTNNNVQPGYSNFNLPSTNNNGQTGNSNFNSASMQIKVQPGNPNFMNNNNNNGQLRNSNLNFPFRNNNAQPVNHYSNLPNININGNPNSNLQSMTNNGPPTNPQFNPLITNNNVKSGNFNPLPLNNNVQHINYNHNVQSANFGRANVPFINSQKPVITNPIIQNNPNNGFISQPINNGQPGNINFNPQPLNNNAQNINYNQNVASANFGRSSLPIINIQKPVITNPIVQNNSNNRFVPLPNNNNGNTWNIQGYSINRRYQSGSDSQTENPNVKDFQGQTNWNSNFRPIN